MSKRVQQYHYRSVAVELAPGRYSRDSWVLEPWFQRDAMRRSTEGKLKLQRVLPPKKKATSAGPLAMHKPEDMQPRRGLYEVAGITDMRANGNFKVVARCVGLYCGGKTRLFQASDWANGRVRVRGCTACVAVMRKEERQRAKVAMGIA